MESFTILDYYRMWKVRGWRLPIQYFFQNHLFDIVNRTNTHSRLEKSEYRNRPEGFDSGVLYMSSLTKEVKESLQRVKENIGDNFFEYQFFDLGCGKGKSILVYLKMFKDQIKHRAIGVEYYKPLVRIAEDNLKKIRLSDKGIIYNSDARKFDEFKTSNKLIIYIYNAFDSIILDSVLDKCCRNKLFLIYVDPVHSKLVYKKGFKILYEKNGYFPNTTYKIFSLNVFD